MSEQAGLLLNVNDDQRNRYVVSRVLLRAGYRVQEADCGSSALDLVTAIRPEIVVLDVKLPDIDGFELCRRIKQLDPMLPILLYSAFFTDEHHMVKGIDVGADGYIPQAEVDERFLANVKALLRIRRAEQALMEKSRTLEKIVERLEAMRADLIGRNMDLEQIADVMVQRESRIKELERQVALLTQQVERLSRREE